MTCKSSPLMAADQMIRNLSMKILIIWSLLSGFVCVTCLGCHHLSGRGCPCRKITSTRPSNIRQKYAHLPQSHMPSCPLLLSLSLLPASWVWARACPLRGWRGRPFCFLCQVCPIALHGMPSARPSPSRLSPTVESL